MRFAICNETYRNWKFVDVCADVAACGYQGIEIALSAIDPDPSRLNEDDAVELGALARNAGLNPLGLHWLLAAPGGLHLTSPDAALRAHTREYLQHLVALCAAMGGKVLVLGSPAQRRILESVDPTHAFEWAVETCRSVSEDAGERGVTLAIEPLDSTITNFLNTAEQTVRFLRAVDHSACRLHLDCYAMSTEANEDPSIPAVIDRYAEDLAHFHANSPDKRGPGSGGFEFEPIAAALERNGYDGWVSVEVFDYELGGPTLARDSIACLREALGRT